MGREAVKWRNYCGGYSLFPLSESGFFEFDLLGESLPEGFLFLLELGIVQFPGLGFPELTRFHLLSAVRYQVNTQNAKGEYPHNADPRSFE